MALNLASCFSNCAFPSSIQTKPTFFAHLVLALGPAARRKGQAPPAGGRGDAGALSYRRETSVRDGTAEPDV